MFGRRNMINNITKKSSSIQKHIPIKEIKDDTVVLKNGGLRAILITTSLNLSLKSTDEQEAIFFRYQDFLNSLDFSIQFVVTSRKLNISDYIAFLDQKRVQQENELLKVQTVEYINFIEELTNMANIVVDTFYLIIPYSSRAVIKTGFIENLFKKKEPGDTTKEKSFQELKNSLWQRLDFVITGLSAIGVKAVPLKTDELIELFYKLYNPSAIEELEAGISEVKK